MQTTNTTDTAPQLSTALARAGHSPWWGLPSAPWVEEDRERPSSADDVWTGQEWEQLPVLELEHVRPCAGVMPGARARRGPGRHVPWSVLDQQLAGITQRRGRTGDAWIWHERRPALRVMAAVQAQCARMADLGRGDLRVPGWLRAEWWALTRNELMLCAAVVCAYESGWGGLLDCQSTVASDLGFSERTLRNALNGSTWTRRDGTVVHRPGLVERGLLAKLQTFKPGAPSGDRPPSERDWCLLRPAGALERAAAWHALGKRWTARAPKGSGWTRRLARSVVTRLRGGAARARFAAAGREHARARRPSAGHHETLRTTIAVNTPALAVTDPSCPKKKTRSCGTRSSKPCASTTGSSPRTSVPRSNSSSPTTTSNSATMAAGTASGNGSLERSSPSPRSPDAAKEAAAADALAERFLGELSQREAAASEADRRAALEHCARVRADARARGEVEYCDDAPQLEHSRETCSALPVIERQDLPSTPPAGGPFKGPPSLVGVGVLGGHLPPASWHPPVDDARKRALTCSFAPAHVHCYRPPPLLEQRPARDAESLPTHRPVPLRDGPTAPRPGRGGASAGGRDIGSMRSGVESMSPIAGGPRPHRSDWPELTDWAAAASAGDELAALVLRLSRDY